MTLLQTFALWSNVIFSGTLLGLVCIIGISMALEKITKLDKLWVSTIAFGLAVVLNVILGGFGIQGTGKFFAGHSDFLRAFIAITPGFTIAWLLIISGVGQKPVKE